MEARAAALRPAPPRARRRRPPRPARPGLELSPSAVEAYRTCPLRYRFAMVDRVPTAPSPARAVGVAAHSALEAHYRPGGTGGDGEALVGRFAAALRRAGVDGTAEGRQALARGREALPPYHERVVRSGTRPVAVEREFTLTVAPHRVHGRVDRIDAHPAGGHQIVDYKTGKPRRRAPAATRTTSSCGCTCSARARRGASSRAGRRSRTSSTARRAGCTPTRRPTRRRSRRCARPPRASPPAASSRARRGPAAPATSRCSARRWTGDRRSGPSRPAPPLEGVYAVRRKERRLSRQGRPFLALTLADATGAVPALVFDEPDYFAASSTRATGCASPAGSASGTAARASW